MSIVTLVRVLACLGILGGLAFAADEDKKKAALAKSNIWAGVTVTCPTIGVDDVVDPRFFIVSFALVNDGDKNFAPTEDVNASKLLVNGKELKDWPNVIGNGPREFPGSALKPGETLEFGKGMGRYFPDPGIYQIKWKSKSFESAEVTFRVLPKKIK